MTHNSDFIEVFAVGIIAPDQEQGSPPLHKVAGISGYQNISSTLGPVLCSSVVIITRSLSQATVRTKSQCDGLKTLTSTTPGAELAR